MLNFFIERPVFSTVIALLMILVGALAAVGLPIAQYPQVVPPQVTVNAVFPGANANVVSQSVAASIEQQVNGAQDMLYMASKSGNDGTYSLTVTFDIGTDKNIDQIEVQNRVAIAQNQLPAEVLRNGITVRKSTSDFLQVISLTSPERRYDTVFLSNYALLNLYDALGRVPGVGQVRIFRQPDANALNTAALVRQVMSEQSARFPPGMVFSVPYSTTPFVTESLKEVVKTLFLAFVLVVIVVFLFLQSWRATLIPILVVPISLIGTFAAFAALGFSINTLTLFGLVLAICIVVDDAIVVVEAVQQRLDEGGVTPVQATKSAMADVGGPVIAIALVLAAVFVPVAFLGGLTGQLYKQFALTLAVSVILSALFALTLTPAMCALLLPRVEARPGRRAPLDWFFAKFNRGFPRSRHGYLASVSLT